MMDPLAANLAVPLGVPTIPTEWIASGAVTPVIATPSATTSTAWIPKPFVAPPAQSGTLSMLDAIANQMFGIAPSGAGSATSPGDAAFAQQQLGMQAYPANVALAAPFAYGPSAQDPTLTGSVSSALSGFAAATGRAVQSVAGVAGSGITHARKVGSELWAGVRSPRSIHITQVPSKYNSAPAAGNKDCGPASVAMTLRLLGRQIPGVAANATPQRLINRVRQLAGNVANTASTTNLELGRALQAAGTKTREIADAVSVRQSVLSGKPVILNGNPRNPGAYGSTFNSSQMTPYNGAHWIVVSGYDSKAGTFIINDPLSKIGPVKVTPAQLEAYRAGSMGIEVEA